MNTFPLAGVNGPHENLECLSTVAEKPTRALLLLHGRGSNGANIMQIAKDVSTSTVVLAPTATDNTWYPQRFLLEKSLNEPYLSSALSVIDALLDHVQREYGLLPKDCVLAGFSQGACLVSEYVINHPQKYKGICIFSGGYIGSDEENRGALSGDLAQTPIYIGCDVEDQFIPIERVESTAHALTIMNSIVTLKEYENTGHTIRPEGLEFLLKVISR